MGTEEEFTRASSVILPAELSGCLLCMQAADWHHEAAAGH